MFAGKPYGKQSDVMGRQLILRFHKSCEFNQLSNYQLLKGDAVHGIGWEG
jgi:hypothetical protein